MTDQHLRIVKDEDLPTIEAALSTAPEPKNGRWVKEYAAHPDGIWTRAIDEAIDWADGGRLYARLVFISEAWIEVDSSDG